MPIRIFASFDTKHDRELYEQLLAQSSLAGSSFTVSAGSKPYDGEDEVWRERTQRKIREADQVIIVCGEATDVAIGVFSELKIVQEEGTPYILLWGRRDRMCTKPDGAKSTEGMYSWTQPILEDQLDRLARVAAKDAEASKLGNRRASSAKPASRSAAPPSGPEADS